MSTGALQSTLRQVVALLDSLDIRYHVTGGLASSYYGEPRLTQDIDLVVQLEIKATTQLARRLSEKFLVNLETMQRAVLDRGMFQALHLGELIKVDFHVGEGIEGEHGRSVVKPLFEDVDVPLVSKEDAILSKLIWVREGSGKSRGDILGMLLDPSAFDYEFVARQSKHLNCGEILESLIVEADRLRAEDKTSD